MALAASSVRAAPACLRVTQALAVGEVPAPRDFVPAACGDAKPVRAVRYDAALRAARLARALQPGDIIAAIPPGLMAGIGPGDILSVESHVGPVVVQRQAEALQPAHPGQKLFVRTADGTVMSVRYPGGAG